MPAGDDRLTLQGMSPAVHGIRVLDAGRAALLPAGGLREFYWRWHPPIGYPREFGVDIQTWVLSSDEGNRYHGWQYEDILAGRQLETVLVVAG